MPGRRYEPRALEHLRRATASWVLLALLYASPAVAFEKPVRIGVLTAAWGRPGALDGLVAGLVDLGYRENEDFVIGVRITQGDLSALPAAAQAMVAGGVDLFLADDEPAAKAVQEATSTHPLIFLGVGDPIGRGLIESYNRPGGNATGVADLDLEVSGKRLQLFKELIPALQRVLFPYDEHNNYGAAQAELYRTAAQRLHVVLVERQLETEDEARAALADLRSEGIDGMLAPGDVSLNIPGLVLEFAAKEGSLRCLRARSIWRAAVSPAMAVPGMRRGGRRRGWSTRSSEAPILGSFRSRRYRVSSSSSISGLRTSLASSSLARCFSRRIGSFGERLFFPNFKGGSEHEDV